MIQIGKNPIKLAERDEFEPSVPLVPPAKGGIVPGLHSPLENPTRSDAG